MIREATPQDIPIINVLLNSPEVYEGASMQTNIPLDAGRVLRANGVVLVNEYGGFMLVPLENDIYEAHMFFLREGRGKKAIEAAHEALRIMFDEKGAEEIRARIPYEDKASRLLTRKIGFRSVGRGSSDYGEPGTRDSEFFEMRKEECPRWP